MPIVEIPDDEYDEDALPDGAEERDDLLTQDEVDGIVQKRLNRQENRIKSDLLGDDDFWEEMARERGVELRDDGKPKGSATDEEIQELRRKASKADSLQSENEELRERMQSTRESGLEQDLREKAPPTENETAQQTFLREAKSRMTYDDEYGWVKTDEDEEIAYQAGEPVGVEGVVSEIEESHSFLFESTSVENGPNTEPSSSTGTMTVEQFEQEVEKARQKGDEERMRELEEMEAEGKVKADESV